MHHRNKYTYIYIIYTQNYALKCTIKYITIAYISKLLKLLLFSKNIYIFFCLDIYKMVELTRKNTMLLQKTEVL